MQRLHRVLKQVDQHLLNLNGVDLDGWIVR